MKPKFDVIVIGAGPSGMTAAIYLKRANLNVVMIEVSAPGGQINRAANVENYPGFNNIDGPTLAMSIFDQTQKKGIEYRYGNILEVIKEDNSFIVKTDVEELKSKAVIIASGRNPKELGLDNEKSLTGRGISWCATCDGPLFKNKNVVVIGGGNSALEEALYLADICKKVTIVHRRDAFRADEIVQSKVLKNKKIKILWNSIVIKLNEKDDKLNNILIKNVITNKESKLVCDGLFIYIGYEPSTRIVENLDITDNKKYIIVDENNKTKIDNLYACGDVIKKELYQIVTATSEGAKAAMSAVKDLII